MENTVQHTGMNKLLLAVVLLLICIGVAMVYTASVAQYTKYDFEPEHYLIAHLKKVVPCLFGILIVSKFDYGFWKIFGRITFYVGLAMTFGSLFTEKVQGAHRWFLGIQPSEILKLGLIIVVCIKLSEAGDNIKTLKYSLIQPGIPFVISIILLGLQPNFSMILLISGVVCFVMIVAGVNMKYLGIAIGCVAPVGLLAMLVSPHSRARIMAFFAEEGEMTASSFQGEHALQALGNGGWFGTGYGQGIQKLGYLPEAHKDVVYSVIGEEIGFAGTITVLALFAILFMQGFKIAQNSSTRFGRYLAFALTMSIFFNFVIHVGVCVGLVPTTGQPLPFISFGGTNLIYCSAAIGIMLNISRSNAGRKINEPYTSESSLDSSVFRNFEFTRSGV